MNRTLPKSKLKTAKAGADGLQEASVVLMEEATSLGRDPFAEWGPGFFDFVKPVQVISTGRVSRVQLQGKFEDGFYHIKDLNSHLPPF